MCVRDVARLGRYDPPMTRGVRRFAVAMVAEPQNAPKLMPIWNRNVSRLENRPSSEPTTGRFGD